MKKRELQIRIEDRYRDVVRWLEDLYNVMVDVYGESSVYHDVRRFWEYDEKDESHCLPITEYMKILTLLDLSLSIYEDYRVGGHHDTMQDRTKLVYRPTLGVMERFGFKIKERRLRYYDYLSSVKPWEIAECIKCNDYNVYNTIGKSMPQPDEDGKHESDLNGFLDAVRGLMDLLEDETKEKWHGHTNANRSA